MKSLWWLILTTCVGAWWLPPAAGLAPTPSTGAAGRGPSLGGAPAPGLPGHAPDFAWEATEPDPEASADGEAQLMGGGGAWAAADRPGSPRPAGSMTRPGGLWRGGWRPPSFPIRC